MEEGSVASAQVAGESVSPEQLPLLSKATRGSRSFENQMVPMGPG